MNKEFYNAYVNQFIKQLIEEKERVVEDIIEISSTFETHGKMPKSLDLSKDEIRRINLLRNSMGALYQLIEDLEKLKK